jgi:polyphosphate kinase
MKQCWSKKTTIKGICSLIPGVKGMSANIEAISIVDNYLEHTRIYIFGNAGQTEVLFLQQIL